MLFLMKKQSKDPNLLHVLLLLGKFLSSSIFGKMEIRRAGSECFVSYLIWSPSLSLSLLLVTKFAI